MEGEQENEQNELKMDRDRVMTADPSKKEDIFVNPDNGHEGVPDETGASYYDKDTLDISAEAGQISRKEYSPTDNSTTTEAFTAGINEVKSPTPHEQSVDFEVNISDENGSPRLNFETPEREIPTRDEVGEAEKEEPTAGPADNKAVRDGDLLQELREERDRARQHSGQLQMVLTEYFYKNAMDDTDTERKPPASEQLQEYEKYANILANLKQQLKAESEKVQQQTEQLDFKSREKLDKVENQWREFLAMKKDVGVKELSRHLGRKAAQAKVESILAAERLHHDEAMKTRLKNAMLSLRIRRLEAELCEGQEETKDPLQLQFERLQAQRLEVKKHADKQSEESLRMEKKIGSRLELLSNIKEKLSWSQTELRAKREQLAQLEETVARKRDLLTRAKRACGGIQRDNLRLKEQRGLLGKTLLLRDFDDRADASQHLEARLKDLKDQQAEIMVRCGRRNQHVGIYPQ